MNFNKVTLKLEWPSLISRKDRYNFPKIETRLYRKKLISAQKELEQSGQLILGKGVKQFESDFSHWLGNGTLPSQVIGVASGTDAIELALRSLYIKAGDLVALPSHTAFATVSAVLRLGARPLFLDTKKDRPILSNKSLQENLSNTTKIRAVIAVHLYGEACNLNEILATCSQYQIPLIEDCAQACGTKFMGQAVGTFGHRAAFSFYPTKNLAAIGDAGALVVKGDEKELIYSRRLRAYGWDESREAVQDGVNSRLDEIQALYLRHKLCDLDMHILSRRKVAKCYESFLKPLIGKTSLIGLPDNGDLSDHSFHLYVIRVLPEARNRIIDYCLDKAIPVSVHYSKPCHQNRLLSQSKVKLPNTEKFVQEIISLPLHPYMNYSDVERVCLVLKEACLKYNNV